MEVARKVKEEHCYVCKDIVKEFLLHERMPGEHGEDQRRARKTGDAWTADVGYERFLAYRSFLPARDIHVGLLDSAPRVGASGDRIESHRHQAQFIRQYRALRRKHRCSRGSQTRSSATWKRLVDTRIAATTKGAKLTSKEVDVEVVTHSFNEQRCGSVGASSRPLRGFYSKAGTKAAMTRNTGRERRATKSRLPWRLKQTCNYIIYIRLIRRSARAHRRARAPVIPIDDAAPPRQKRRCRCSALLFLALNRSRRSR